MNDFLSLLRKNRQPGWSQRREAPTDFYFQLVADENGCYVQTVNAKGMPVCPDYHAYTGDTAQALRTMERLREEGLLQFRWEGAEASDKLYVAESPYWVGQLVRCPHLMNAQMQPVRVSDHPATLRLHLKGEEARLVPTLTVDGTEVPKGWAVLTDSLLLAGDTIFPIASLGDNYRHFPTFMAPFDKVLVEEYLSLFYSYIDQVDVAYEDYTVCRSDTPLKAIPTLVFEKVDADHALHLRMTYSVPGCEIGFLENFDVEWKATLMPDRQLSLKRVEHEPIEECIASLSKQLDRYAPSRSAQKEIYQEGGFFIVPEDTAAPFLLKELPSLLHTYRLMGADKLKAYRVKPVQPKLNLSLSSGIDFLEGDLTLDLEGETFTLNHLLNQYRKQRYITLSDGDRAVLDEGYIRRLERVFQHKRGDKVRVSFFDLPEVEELMRQRLEGEAFVRHREVFDGFNHLKEQPLKLPPLNAELRPYQVEGVKWMRYLYDVNLGGCLADDMGLGKTLQTIAVLASCYPKTKKPSLIVMPRSLLFNWQAELKRFAPQLSVYTYYGTTRDLKEAKKSQLILTTYAIVRNDVEQFSKQKFHYVVLDESQNIKNTGAQVTQAVLLLDAAHRLALSGTPVENNLTELYSLFRFLNPAMFGSLEDFNSRYTYPIQKDNDKEAMESLRRKIYPFLLRRLKKEVLTELPDRIDNRFYVEMSPEQARFYEQRRAYYYQQVKQTIATDGIQKSQFVMFQALNELRRIASVPESLSDGRITSPKLEVLMDSVTEAVSNGHKVVIFFNYIAGIELVGDKLNENGIDFTSMTGSTHDRKGVVERFQNDPQCRVLLMTLKTGGVGLNLTAADTVYIFEPWWNKAAEEQAVNRLHRFGQTAKVLCYSILVQGSIEEKICQLQQQKAELFEELIGNDSGSIKQLSEEDIQYILG